MKPKNFPARKLARQIAAEIHLSASEVYEQDIDRGGSLTHARNQRSKKSRAA